MSNVAFVRSISDRISENVEKVILGKRKEVQITLQALVCEGHLLIEDVPGVGKTMLARTIAHSMGCAFNASSSRPTCCRPT